MEHPAPHFQFLGIALMHQLQALALALKRPRSHNTALPKDQVTSQTSSAMLEDVIFLDNDSLSNDDEPPDPHLDSSADQGTSQSEPMIPNGDDNDEESMSLSDLSSSFQKCLHPNQSTDQDAVSKGRCSKFKPFDYEAARREVKFGEDTKRKVDTGGNDDTKRVRGRKKVVLLVVIRASKMVMDLVKIKDVKRFLPVGTVVRLSDD